MKIRLIPGARHQRAVSAGWAFLPLRVTPAPSAPGEDTAEKDVLGASVPPTVGSVEPEEPAAAVVAGLAGPSILDSRPGRTARKRMVARVVIATAVALVPVLGILLLLQNA